ncbi:MAG: anti-sigma factor antagonist, partial [Christensenellaceae bacterium]|nr:anti-sigma factor antagonist [Christensenellaceae bacterium]
MPLLGHLFLLFFHGGPPFFRWGLFCPGGAENTLPKTGKARQNKRKTAKSSGFSPKDKPLPKKNSFKRRQTAAKQHACQNSLGGMSMAANNNGNIKVVRLKGEIDHHNAQRLRQMLDELIEREKVRDLVLDMAAVELMDSSGIGL